MTQPIEIKIGEETRFLRFNQYANIELYKLLFNDPFANPDMGELLEKANQMIKDNHMLFYKAVIYSGIVGYDYASEMWQPSVTLQEVGEAVGNMTPNDLHDFFIAVWNNWFDAMGVNLEEIKGSEPEKKK